MSGGGDCWVLRDLIGIADATAWLEPAASAGGDGDKPEGEPMDDGTMKSSIFIGSDSAGVLFPSIDCRSLAIPLGPSADFDTCLSSLFYQS